MVETVATEETLIMEKRKSETISHFQIQHLCWFSMLVRKPQSRRGTKETKMKGVPILNPFQMDIQLVKVGCFLWETFTAMKQGTLDS